MSISESFKASQFEESVIRGMTRLCRQYNGVNLSQGFPDFPAPEMIKEAAKKAIDDDVNQYAITWGTSNLRQAISRKLKHFYNWDIDPEKEITVTCGSTEGMIASLLATLNPDDEVVIFAPFYENYGPDAIICGAVPRYVQLNAPDWSFDLAELEAAFTEKTRAIIINTPHNPTGKVFSKTELEIIAELCQRHDVLAITDEIYEHILYDGVLHLPLAKLPGMAERTITINGISKTYSVTGWRIGYLHADEELIPQIAKAHIPLAICAPVVSQYAALAALQGPQDCVARFREHYLAARNLMCERLDRLSSVFEYRKPGGSYLMFPGIRPEAGKDSTAFCKNLLAKAKVSTTPGIAFGPTGQSHLRLSFCVSEQEINKAFDRMEDYCGRVG